MWGTFLSEPLRIVALVGRCPANQLMRRMPIRRRIAPFPSPGCPEEAYAVLVGISPGYPPAAGRLHTCYSPVRRSPPEISKLTPALPLDLHVLSLSLAFILSQDQTLRCCILFFFFFFMLSRSAFCLRPLRSPIPIQPQSFVCPSARCSFAYRVDISINLSRVSLKH